MGIGSKLKKAAFYVLERAKEPSTYTAVGTLMALNHADPQLVEKVTQGGGAAAVVVALLMGVFLPENKKTD